MQRPNVFRHTIRFGTYLIVFSSFLLAGCGGSFEGGCFWTGDCPTAPQPPPPPPDTTPPVVFLVYPNASATYVSPSTNISAYFDRRLDGSSVTASNFVVRDATSQPVSGVLSYYDQYVCYTTGCGYGITFDPQNALTFGGQYTVTLTGIRNASGYAMTSNYTWSFTVLPVGSGTWQPTATTNAPPPRYDHTAVWTGSEMIVWGGQNTGSVTNTGARYDPANDAWQPTSTQDAPSLSGHTAVWTGSEMVVWGADTSGASIGRRYHPASDTWRTVTTSNSPPATSHTAVWTGNRMIVWGGNPYSNSGGIYDPVSDSWQPTSLANAPLGRVGHTAVWTGTEMIIWGGMAQTGTTVGRTNTGGRYNPVTDTWIAMSTLDAPEPREFHTAVWTGSKMIVWGGWGNTYLNSGGVYDPATDTWQTVSITDAPPARAGHTAVWSGNEMIVWGGSGSGAANLNNGARYNPIASTWTATSNTNSPSSVDSHSAVWTGTQMIVWGGHVQTGINTGTDTGGRYSP